MNIWKSLSKCIEKNIDLIYVMSIRGFISKFQAPFVWLIDDSLDRLSLKASVWGRSSAFLRGQKKSQSSKFKEKSLIYAGQQPILLIIMHWSEKSTWPKWYKIFSNKGLKRSLLQP